MRKLALILALALVMLLVMGQTRTRVGVEDIQYGYSSQDYILSSTGDTITVMDVAPVNVLWFGADNTGSSNCTDSIAVALDSLISWNSGVGLGGAGGALYFPAGDYLVDSIPIAVDGLTIFGDGPEATNIYSTATDTSPIFVNTADVEHIVVRDLSVQMCGGTSNAFDLDDVSKSIFSRIDIYQASLGGKCTGAAFKINYTDGAAHSNSFYDIHIDGDDTLSYGFQFLSGASEQRLYGCHFGELDTAVHITDCKGIRVDNCTFDDFELGVWLPNSSGDPNWVHNSFFKNGVTGAVGVWVPGNSDGTRIIANSYSSVDTAVSDYGTNTRRVADQNRTWLDYVRVTAGDTPSFVPTAMGTTQMLGMLFFDQADSTLKVWDGDEWQDCW